MDEHSPYWKKPEDPESFWEEIPGGAWVFLVPAIALILALLMGCDSAELDRLQAAADQRDRIARACFPQENQRITVSREDGFLFFTYIDIGPGRYSRTFPHAEIRIKEVSYQ